MLTIDDCIALCREERRRQALGFPDRRAGTSPAV